jgi:hypothetical protein
MDSGRWHPDLSPEQYEAIGRLTIRFNHIEAVIDVYLDYS